MTEGININYTYQNQVVEIEFYSEKANSMTSDLLEKFANTIVDLNFQKDVKIILISSQSTSVFCSGASFDELLTIDEYDKAVEFFSAFANLINAFRSSNKIIVGKITGKSVGGGVGMISAMDYCFALDNADIKLSELSIGIGPFVIAPAVINRMGMKAYKTLSLNPSNWMPALRAKECGLYNNIYANQSDLEQGLVQFITQLQSYSHDAVQSLKQSFWTGMDNWDILLYENAKISAQLLLTDYTKSKLKDFKSKK